MRTHALLFAVVVLAACQKPETPEQMAARMSAESDSARTAIEAADARFMGYFNAGHGDSLAMLYTTNAVLMPPNTKAVMGRDSIRAWMTASPMPAGARLTLHTMDVSANGPMAIEHGTFTMEMPAMGSVPAMTNTGKFLAHWHKVDGQWLMAADIWNDDVPPPPPAPAHR